MQHEQARYTRSEGEFKYLEGEGVAREKGT